VTALPTNWANNVGMSVDAAFLNLLGGNVNAAYVLPVGGITSSDLAAAVVASLGRADTAMQAADIAAAQYAVINAQTVSYTLALTDVSKSVEVNSATVVNVTVPPNSSVAFPVGTMIEVVQIGAGQITIVAGAGVTVNPTSAKTRVQWSSLGLRKRATNTWLVTGDMA